MTITNYEVYDLDTVRRWASSDYATAFGRPTPTGIPVIIPTNPPKIPSDLARWASSNYETAFGRPMPTGISVKVPEPNTADQIPSRGYGRSISIENIIFLINQLLIQLANEQAQRK